MLSVDEEKEEKRGVVVPSILKFQHVMMRKWGGGKGGGGGCFVGWGGGGGKKKIEKKENFDYPSPLLCEPLSGGESWERQLSNFLSILISLEKKKKKKGRLTFALFLYSLQALRQLAVQEEGKEKDPNLPFCPSGFRSAREWTRRRRGLIKKLRPKGFEKKEGGRGEPLWVHNSRGG